MIAWFNRFRPYVKYPIVIAGVSIAIPLELGDGYLQHSDIEEVQAGGAYNSHGDTTLLHWPLQIVEWH